MIKSNSFIRYNDNDINYFSRCMKYVDFGFFKRMFLCSGKKPIIFNFSVLIT